MTTDPYATAEESASVIKPDTRTAAQKVLYKLQSEQTNGFEMGHEIDNGAIALKLIEQNAELLAALQAMLEVEPSDEWGGCSDKELAAISKAEAVIAKTTTGT